MATIVFAPDSRQKSTTSMTDGERFEGMVKAGRLNGIGQLTKRDGTVVEGIWREN